MSAALPPLEPAREAEPVPPPGRLDARRGGSMPGTVLISSDQLFGGAVEVQIEHRGALYRLKQTALGKLILTK